MNSIVSSHTRRKRFHATFASPIAVAIAAAIAVAWTVPASLASAQGGKIVAVRTRTGPPPMNSCVQLKAMPSPLVGTPEGFEVLKMQQELAQVRDRMNTSPADSSSAVLKRVLIAGNGVDSIVRFYSSSVDGGQNSFTIMVRPGGAGEPLRGMPTQSDRFVFETMVREMQPRVDELVRGSFMGTINVRSTAPGYLGVSTTTSTFPSVLDTSRDFGYCDYPRIETVDVGSPADKVGLSAGDTLLAYNNRDLLQYDVNYQSLLVPGKPLRIKFRRDGQVREVSPTIVPRETEARVFVAARQACADPRMRAECEGPQLVTARGFGIPSQSGGSVATGTRVAVPSILYPMAPGQALLGGASLKVVTEAFAKNSGVVAGLMVLDVRDGSPASAAGLRDGDVLISANGTTVRDVNGLSNALASRMREHLAVLQVSSSSGVRTVTLRWP